MRIELNGAMIYFDNDEFDEVEKLRCVCGHTIFEHGSPIMYGNPNWIPTSQCTVCPITKDNKFTCEQFRIKGT